MNKIPRLISNLIICYLISSTAALAAPSAELWDRWITNDVNATTTTTTTIDHSVWNQLVNRYVVNHKSGVNLFKYKVVSKADKANLTRYLKDLSNIKISRYNQNQQRAYWINLYNALTVDEILFHYPVKSIRDISSGFFTSGPWEKDLITVEQEVLTLNDIEHRILRPIWKDPRLHYALNCASIGCPNLQTVAFTADNTEGLLDKAAREFINHPRGASVDHSGRLSVSSIYHWFGEDFGGDSGVVEHLRQYAESPLKQALKNIDDDFDHQYDWSLNGLTKPRVSSTRGSGGS